MQLAELAAIDAVTAAMREVDLDALDSVGRRRLLGRIRSAQATLAGLVSTLGRLEVADPAVGPRSDLLLGGGEVSGRQARQESKRVELGADLPTLGAHHERGLVSAPHMDVVARTAARLSDEQRSELHEFDAWIAERANELPVDVFAKQMRDLHSAIAASDASEQLADDVERSNVRRWVDDDGLGHTELVLDRIRHDELGRALDAEVARRSKAERRAITPALSAEALHGLVVAGSTRPGAAPRGAVSVLVDLDTLELAHHRATICETEHGEPVPLTTLDRILCDAQLDVLVRNPDGTVDTNAASQRVATPAQRRALRAMYPTCAHPGCDVAFDWCQIHHIIHWRDGGPTVLSNLIPQCSEHHHLVHDAGWTQELLADRTLIIRQRDGTEVARRRLPAADDLERRPRLRPDERRRLLEQRRPERPADSCRPGGAAAPPAPPPPPRRRTRTPRRTARRASAEAGS